jgi:hypothetical protein
MKFDIRVFLENLSRRFKFSKNLTRITNTLHEEQYTFVILSRSLLLIMRNDSDKIAEKIKTHILWSITFFSQNCAVYEIMWENSVEQDRTHENMAHAHSMLDT